MVQVSSVSKTKNWEENRYFIVKKCINKVD